MPVIAGPDGRKVSFPEGTSDADIALAFGGGPSPSASAPTQHGASGDFGDGPPGLLDRVRNWGAKTFPSVAPNADEGGFSYFGPRVDNFIANAGNRVARNLTGMPASLVDMVRQGYNDPESLQSTVGPYGVMPFYHMGADAVHTVRAQPNVNGVSQAASDLTGDIGTMYLTGKALGAAPEAAAETLNTLGRGTKAVGRGVSRFTTGAPSPSTPELYDANIGGALSENRIVGASPRSLRAKVAAKVGPAAQARDAILDRSNAGPVDIGPSVDDPFRRIASEKTDPTTGAARPGQVRSLSTVRRAIQEVQDPETGTPTGEPKPTQLFPAEIGQLQRNIYDMTDYSSPDSDLANQGLKGAAANLREKLLQVSPESGGMTRNIHNLLGAEDFFKSRTGAPPSVTDLGPGKLAGRLYDAVRYGGGTAAGAGLDVAGSGLMKLGGAIRNAANGFPSSPVAPTSPIDSRLPTPRALPASIPAEASEGVAVDLDPERFPPGGPAVVTPHTPVAGALPATTTTGEPGAPPVGILHPGTIDPALARTRIAPNPRTLNQQVLSDQPGYTPAAGSRRILASPEGLRPEPIPLGSGEPPAAPAVATPAGPRLSLSSKVKSVSTKGARPKPTLATQVESAPSRLPDPADIDGWEALADKGWARYNTQTHSYEYTGPTRRSAK